MIRLFTTFYDEQDLYRKNELLYSIKKNASLKSIACVYILDEESGHNFSNNEKIKKCHTSKRPTFNDFFEIINNISDKNDINIIANTDIFFDENIKSIEKIIKGDECYALSRWNIDDNKKSVLFNRNDSQDIWIFKGKIKNNIKGNFALGIPRCDNRIMYEIKKAGYIVKNPSFSIKSYHIHKNCLNDYPEGLLPNYIPEPYLYLFPHNIYGLFKTFIFNLTNKYKIQPYRYDPKKLNKWVIMRFVRKIIRIIFKKNLPLIGYNY